MLNIYSEWCMPTKITCKEKAIDYLGEIVSCYGKKSVIIVGQKSMIRLGFVERAKESLRLSKIDSAVYSGVPQEPLVDDIKEIIDFVKKENADFIVALGGGSVIDASKAASVGAVHEGEIYKYLRSKEYGDQISEKTLPIIVVPTTAGSGSETSCYSVLNSPKDKVKDVLVSKYLYPKECIIDPDISSNAPNFIKLSSGLDVLSHAVEAYLSKRCSCIVAGLAIEAVSLVIENLPKVLQDNSDMKAHANMAYASAIAGACIGNAGTIIGHALGHAWGAATHVNHGLAVGALIPWVMELGLKGDGIEKLAYLADNLKITSVTMNDKEKATKLIDEINHFFNKVGFDITSLKQYVDNASLNNIIQIAIEQPVTLNTPYKVQENDILEIFNKICKK